MRLEPYLKHQPLSLQTCKAPFRCVLLKECVSFLTGSLVVSSPAQVELSVSLSKPAAATLSCACQTDPSLPLPHPYPPFLPTPFLLLPPGSHFKYNTPWDHRLINCLKLRHRSCSYMKYLLNDKAITPRAWFMFKKKCNHCSTRES